MSALIPRYHSLGAFVLELGLAAILTAVAIGYLVPAYVCSTFYIPSESMLPTLKVNDRVLVNKVTYLFREPRRGDVVVFKGVVDGEQENLIKRVVALPGDHVVVDHGTLLVDGVISKVPRGDDLPADVSSFGPYTVPEGTVFVMGDNRGDSYDSRFFGPVRLDEIEGKAVFTLWPPPDIFSSSSKLSEEQFREG